MISLDEMWLKKCKTNPRRYKIYIGADYARVIDIESPQTLEVVYEFSTYAQEFTVLEYLGYITEIIKNEY